MRLRVERFLTTSEATLGLLFVDETFFCFTLEDTFREVKVKGKTRIPSGRYKIELRKEGGMLEKYKQKFGEDHKGMLWLRNVTDFEFVYLHVGNSDADTEGCILLGEGCTRKPPSLSDSTMAYKRLYPMVYQAIEKGGEVLIEVLDKTPF